MIEPSTRLDAADWICDYVDQCERGVRDLERGPHFGDAVRRMVERYCSDVVCLCEALKIGVSGLRGMEDHSVSGDPATARQLLNTMKEKMHRRVWDSGVNGG